MCIRDRIKPSQLTRKQIDDYVVGLIREKRISESHQNQILSAIKMFYACLLYTSDAADERSSVDLGGRRIIKKKKTKTQKSRRRMMRYTEIDSD